MALLTVFASLTAHAQSASPFMGAKGAAISGSEPNSPRGLAGRANSQRGATTHYQFRWFQDYGGGSATRGSGLSSGPVQKGLSLSDDQ
jgi:hypothetical protein